MKKIRSLSEFPPFVWWLGHVSNRTVAVFLVRIGLAQVAGLGTILRKNRSMGIVGRAMMMEEHAASCAYRALR